MLGALSDLTALPSSCRVSSVLQRNVKDFGAQHMLDGSSVKCWNSDQGSPQWVRIRFNRPVRLVSVQMMFQGGFAGKEVSFSTSVQQAPLAEVAAQKRLSKPLGTVYPEDHNELQSFCIKHDDAVQDLSITFRSSTDFFGRITIYQLKILGMEVLTLPQELGAADYNNIARIDVVR